VAKQAAAFAALVVQLSGLAIFGLILWWLFGGMVNPP
jgi:hypothetical protein